MAEYKGFGGNKALLEELLQMAKRPKGFVSTEVTGYTTQYVSTFCCFMADKANPPRLFRAKLGHRSCVWFDTAERAEAYQATHRKRGSGTIAYQPPSKRKCNFADSDEAVTTAKTKYTPAKPVPERFPDDGKRVSHLGSRQLLEYDMPASGWARAVVETVA